jgi:hypothetical protein
MAGFAQIIEMQTSRIDEVEALIRELRDRLDDGGSSARLRGTMTADRDREGFYLSIVEFDSYEAAMENSTGRRSANTRPGWRSSVTPRPSSTTSTYGRHGSLGMIIDRRSEQVWSTGTRRAVRSGAEPT